MILLLIAAWILVLSIVAGLCAAARIGDDQSVTQEQAPAGWGLADPLAWVRAEHVEVSAHANVHAVRPAESGAALVASGGVAA